MAVCALLGLKSRRVLPKPDRNARLVRNDIRAEVDVRPDERNRDAAPSRVQGLPNLMQG